MASKMLLFLKRRKSWDDAFKPVYYFPRLNRIGSSQQIAKQQQIVESSADFYRRKNFIH
jgi:hypothetical protein